MSAAGARVVRDWYRGSAWLWLLLPLSALFYLVSGLRRVLYRCGFLTAQRVPVPVLVVGNITAGGSGKTPLVEALARHLRATGYQPGIASRGYGGQPPQTPYRVTADSDVRDCGDEPLLLFQRCRVPVVVDRDRVAAARYLVEQCGCDIILTDDGLQHYRLARDIEIAVVDGERGLGNSKLLPMGPLRETPGRLQSVNYVVSNGSFRRGRLPVDALVTMELQPCEWVNLHTGRSEPLQAFPQGRCVHAVAGIGNPQRFFQSLRAIGLEVREHAFDDHYAYTGPDLQFDDGLPVIMTEKDAVKCQSLVASDRYWYLRISAGLPDSFYQSLERDIRQSVANRQESQ